MKTKLPVVILALLATLNLTAQELSFVKETPGTTIYSETFDTPRALQGCQILSGSWSVENHRLKATRLNGQNRILLPEIARGSDLAIQADVRFTEAKNPSRWFSLMLRADPAGRHVFTHTAIRWNQHAEITNAVTQDGRQTWQVLTYDPAPRKQRPTDVKTYRLELRKTNAKLFVNHVLVAEVNLPPNSPQQGRAGILTDNATIEVDNLLVQKLPPLTAEEKKHIRSRLIALPAVIAHRGFSEKFPENTLIAYNEAVKAGAQGVEIDARISRDGIPYCLHDTTLDRTTDGTGKPQNATMEELKKLDAGAFKGPQFKGTRIPTFEEVLVALKGKACILIDLKEIEAADALIAIIARHRAAEQIIVATAHAPTAKKFHDRLPGCRLIYITGAVTEFTSKTLFRIKRQHYDAIFPCFRLPLKFNPRQARLMGLSFYGWTINSPEMVRQAWQAGIDAIVTDRPDMVLETLETCRDKVLDGQDQTAPSQGYR